MTEKAGIVVGTIIAVLVATVLAFGLWAGLRITEADRHYRTARAAACRTIEDQSLRTLCLVKP